MIEQLTSAGIIQKTLTASAVTSFLLIGPAEELFKLLAVWVAIYRSLDFREPLDGMLYSSTAALGFVCVENVIYILELGPPGVMSRLVFATPAHALFAAVWGYALGVARFRREGEILIIFKGLLAAALLHGIYNFVIALAPKQAMISLTPLMIFMTWLSYTLAKNLRTLAPIAPEVQNAVICCSNCGAWNSENRRVCVRCDVALDVGAPQARFCGRCRVRLSALGSCSACEYPTRGILAKPVSFSDPPK